MRLVVWVLLVALSLASVAVGRLDLALVFASAKAVLLGFEFMELRHAARLHLGAYVLFVVLIAGVLEVMTLSLSL